MRQKAVEAQRLQWDSPQVGHICLALDIKNNVVCTDPFLKRGRRLSREEITNRSVCPQFFCCNLLILSPDSKKILNSMLLHLPTYIHNNH